jgi:hypothetical protein
MRFRAKVINVFVAIQCVFFPLYAACCTFDLSFLRSHHQLRLEHTPLYSEYWMLPLVFCFLLFTLYQSFPNYFELQESSLFIRQGWKKLLIPYASIEKILPISGRFGGKSQNRIVVITAKGMTFTIAAAEQERFMAEISKRCPQLEKRETELGLSLQRAIL